MIVLIKGDLEGVLDDVSCSTVHYSAHCSVFGTCLSLCGYPVAHTGTRLI